MKANLTNLRKALKACAKAHNVEFKDWSNEDQLGVHSDSIPVLADVRMICEAFFGPVSGIAEAGWGFVTVWLGSKFLPEVNEELMYMALPYGTKL